jgi:hypothetical protein
VQQLAETEEVALWSKNFPHARNTGMLTERTPAIDIDIEQADAATAVEELARERFDGRGTILVRFGKKHQNAHCYFGPVGRSENASGIYCAGGSPHKIEVLGRGQQLVVAGIHPDTKRPYSWHGGYEPGAIPRSDLPEIDEREARAFLAQATDMLAKEYNFQQIKPNGSAAPAGEPTPTIDVASRLGGHALWRCRRCIGS